VSEPRQIEKLRRDHDIAAFDCGEPHLNDWLLKHALQNQGAGAAQTYVGLVDGLVVGYYSLAAGQVEYGDAPERLRKGLARHPVPIVLLARLAVQKDWQGKRIGRALLRDAVLRTLQAADIAGIRALAVHAKDDEARRYYEQFDFMPSPSDPLHLSVLLKDLRKLAEGCDRRPHSYEYRIGDDPRIHGSPR
jgi:GNAT superfamily N-acetyltransferase